MREVLLWMPDAAVCRLLWATPDPVALPFALAVLRLLLSEVTGGAAGREDGLPGEAPGAGVPLMAL